jgi:hypothetical protein
VNFGRVWEIKLERFDLYDEFMHKFELNRLAEKIENSERLSDCTDGTSALQNVHPGVGIERGTCTKSESEYIQGSNAYDVGANEKV